MNQLIGVFAAGKMPNPEEVITESELTALDTTLSKLAQGMLGTETPNEDDWIAPGAYAFRSQFKAVYEDRGLGEPFPPDNSWATYYKEGLTDARAFMEAFLDAPVATPQAAASVINNIRIERAENSPFVIGPNGQADSHATTKAPEDKPEDNTDKPEDKTDKPDSGVLFRLTKLVAALAALLAAIDGLLNKGETLKSIAALFTG